MSEQLIDRTVWRETFRTDLSTAVTKATHRGISRVQTIADMLEFANELREICEAEGDDLTPLQGLLQ